MVELAEWFLKYWVLLGFIISTSFTIGGLFVKVQSVIKAHHKLFEKTDTLELFKSAQENENKNRKMQVDKLEHEIVVHNKEAAGRYAAIVSRIDDIFKLLSSK